MKREDLLRALEVVRPGLADKETIEQTTSFAFMNGRVVTYNDEISISTPVEGLGKKLEGAIKADELYQLLARIKKDEIEIEMTDKEIQISAGRAKAGMPLQKEIKLPLEELGEQTDWHKLPENFIQAIKYALAACSNNSSYPMLGSINVQASGNVVSSDNFRITRYTLKPLYKSFLIPAKAGKDLIKYGVDQICDTKGWAHFLTGDGKTRFSCRTYEGEYPDVTPYLEVSGSAMELPHTIPDILDRAAVFSKAEEVTENRVEVSLTTNLMKVRVEGPAGWFEEEARLQYGGDPVRFSVNPILFKDIVAQVQSCVFGGNRMKFTGENWEHVIGLLAAKEK